eukprot:TRINITY_DN8445_c0_g1_i1.p1 TRINITY_DN8445_c0_g1~~TRINITY_DN8445_c0_g1_i1.p1  ORF type:complete len:176 (-),score=38.83 TRINITY_DN8445_c0_g1_i1:21-548(-)
MKAVLVLFVFVTLSFAAIHRTEFALHAEGNCPNRDPYCKLKAQSQELIQHISPTEGVVTEIVYLQGTYAEFTFHIEAHPNGTHFYSDGNVTFGTHMFRNHVIYFKNLGLGDALPGPDSTTLVISSLYTITKGAGAFEGASGVMAVTGVIDLAKARPSFIISGYLYHEKAEGVLEE